MVEVVAQVELVELEGDDEGREVGRLLGERADECDDVVWPDGREQFVRAGFKVLGSETDGCDVMSVITQAQGKDDRSFGFWRREADCAGI